MLMDLVLRYCLMFEGGRIEEWLDGRVMTREDLTVENIQKLVPTNQTDFILWGCVIMT